MDKAAAVVRDRYYYIYQLRQNRRIPKVIAYHVHKGDRSGLGIAICSDSEIPRYRPTLLKDRGGNVTEVILGGRSIAAERAELALTCYGELLSVRREEATTVLSRLRLDIAFKVIGSDHPQFGYYLNQIKALSLPRSRSDGRVFGKCSGDLNLVRVLRTDPRTWIAPSARFYCCADHMRAFCSRLSAFKWGEGDKNYFFVNPIQRVLNQQNQCVFRKEKAVDGALDKYAAAAEKLPPWKAATLGKVSSVASEKAVGAEELSYTYQRGSYTQEWEAIQWTGNNLNELKTFSPGRVTGSAGYAWLGSGAGVVDKLDLGDWVVRYKGDGEVKYARVSNADFRSGKLRIPSWSWEKERQ